MLKLWGVVEELLLANESYPFMSRPNPPIGTSIKSKSIKDGYYHLDREFWTDLPQEAQYGTLLRISTKTLTNNIIITRLGDNMLISIASPKGEWTEWKKFTSI